MRILINLLIMFYLLPSFAHALDAFPGAVGYGKASAGGRGGTVYIVDQLGDDAAAEASGTTFREAASASGARTITFAVSGLIELESILYIDNPYLTIAGQTSPGGISIIGYTVSIMTHDVIVQHMRFRVGSKNTADCLIAETLDSLSVLGENWMGQPVYNVMLDHLSVSWGVDETMTITGGANGITISNSIVSEGLRGSVASGTGCDGSDWLHPDGPSSGGDGHSKGLFVSGKYNDPQTVSMYRNYLPHHMDRTPLLYAPLIYQSNGVLVPNGNIQYVEGSNNVTYNFNGNTSPGVEGHLHVNWFQNYVKGGADSNASPFEVTFFNRYDAYYGSAEPLLYSYNNIGTTSTGGADWNVGWYYYQGETYSDSPWGTPQDTNSWQSVNPINFPDLISNAGTADEHTSVHTPIPAETMTYAYAQEILTDVGATKPFRDSVDTRVVGDFAAGTGAIIDNIVYPDDYPTYTQITPPTDSDSDGIADSWEVANLGVTIENVSSALPTGDYNSDGYDNIENYLHSLAGATQTQTRKPTHWKFVTN